MKKIILLFLLVLGCEKKNLFDELENKLYQLDEVYVLIDEDEIMDLDIQKKEYDVSIGFKTLVIYEQKEFYVFYNGYDSLKNKLNKKMKEGYELFEIDSYLYYGTDDSRIIEMVKETLNK